MDSEAIENEVKRLVSAKDTESFIYDLLLAYHLPKTSITRLKKGSYNLAKTPGEILWKNRLCFVHETKVDVHVRADALKNDAKVAKQKPRFIVVTDFKVFVALDTKTEDSLDIKFNELPKHYDFFLPWAGMEKYQGKNEAVADRKSAEKMARLYELILEENEIESDSDRHALNVFLSRLLFCFFAEDTQIFSETQPALFTKALADHTSGDGGDLQPYLQKLFKVLNTEEKAKSRSKLPQYLQDFPYVNGGLFAKDSEVPKFNAKSRKIIIECGQLDWKQINPDIFGSMMQAVMHDDMRANLGAHYTSVVNIKKVIDPLFINDLEEELEKAGTSKKKLNALLDRIYSLRIFDPACGSGNFLIISYKRLCELEIDIFERLYEIGKQTTIKAIESKVSLSQFYGIEIDDFACETAKLSLWLAEHQMNMRFKEVFLCCKATLPLKDGGHIVRGNALRLEWSEVCPKDNAVETYLIGNPPYLGSTWQNKKQKEDLALLFSPVTNKYKNLDYVASWYLKGAHYVASSKAQCAFVATNSICQGEQVSLLWHLLFALGIEIGFAHTSFKWTNNATGNAGVTCIVVGIRRKSKQLKSLFENSSCREVENIGPYLNDGGNGSVSESRTPMSAIPVMDNGSKPADGRHLSINMFDFEILESKGSKVISFTKKYWGAEEFINGKNRYCLWIEDDEVEEALKIPFIQKRVALVREFRLKSKKKPTQKKAEVAHRFAEPRYKVGNSVFVPKVSSERRKYIPIGFVGEDTVISDLGFAIYDAEPWIFAVISSRMHMDWVRTVGGRLETRIRYSSKLCYNTFPFPDISDSQKEALEEHVFAVLDERELHPEKTLADLYDPDKMPEGLAQAHHKMDLAIERCYRKKPFKDDTERLTHLFQLYEKMTSSEAKAVLKS